jgi:uncharacterized RDD family membrane protein YckC
MDRLDTTVSKQTPERVRFRFRLAGPGLRGVAWIVDMLVQGTILAVYLLVLPLDRGVSGGAFLVFLFLLTWFYAAVFELIWSGQTPGKRLMAIRVIASDGSAASPGQILLRNLLRAADGLPFLYVVGVLVCIADSSLRRLGDIVADTMVVCEDRGRLDAVLSIEPPLTEDEIALLPGRVVLSPDERVAIELLLRRLHVLPPARAAELAGPLAENLSDRYGLTKMHPVRLLAMVWSRATGRTA